MSTCMRVAEREGVVARVRWVTALGFLGIEGKVGRSREGRRKERRRRNGMVGGGILGGGEGSRMVVEKESSLRALL